MERSITVKSANLYKGINDELQLVFVLDNHTTMLNTPFKRQTSGSNKAKK